jgi:hypothetical protein
MSTESSRSQTPQPAVMGNPGLRAKAVTNSLTHWSHLSLIMNFPQLNPVSRFCRDMLSWKKTGGKHSTKPLEVLTGNV